MSIKATWKNLIVGVRARCIFNNNRWMMTGNIQAAQQTKFGSNPTEGHIEILFDGETEPDTNWGSLNSFEIVGPLVSWQNIVPGLPVRLVDRATAKNVVASWGEGGFISNIDETLKTFFIEWSGGIRELMTDPSAFEIRTAPCDWTNITKGDTVCCLVNHSRQYGNLGTITEYNQQDELVSVDYSSGYPLHSKYDKPWQLAKMPGKPINIQSGMPASQITEVVSDVPKPTGFDWDAYGGIKTKPQGRIVLDPRGGVRRIKL